MDAFRSATGSADRDWRLGTPRVQAVLSGRVAALPADPALRVSRSSPTEVATRQRASFSGGLAIAP